MKTKPSDKFLNRVRNTNAILYCISGNFLDVFTASLTSLCLNNKNEKFDIIIFHNYSTHSLDKLESIIEKFKSSNYLFYSIYIDFPFDVKILPLHGHIDISTYFRLLLEFYIPTNYDRILYLDSDTIIHGSIGNLFAIDLEGKIIGAVNHNFKKDDSVSHLKNRFIKLGLEEVNYFNAGVLIIDFKKWLNFGVWEKSLNILNRYTSLLEWWDQDILNIIFKENVTYISPKFNFIHFCMKDLLNLKEEILIYHFAGPAKPWFYFSKVFAKEVYWIYYSNTLFIQALTFKRFFQNVKIIGNRIRKLLNI